MNEEQVNILILCFEGTDAKSEKKLFNDILNSNEKKKNEKKSWKEIINDQGIIKINVSTIKLEKNFDKEMNLVETRIKRVLKTIRTDSQNYRNVVYFLIDRDDKEKEKLFKLFLKNRRKEIRSKIEETYDKTTFEVVLYPENQNLEYLIACFLECNKSLSHLTKRQIKELIESYGIDIENDIKTDTEQSYFIKAKISPTDAWGNLCINLCDHHDEEKYQDEKNKLSNEICIKMTSFAHFFNICNGKDC